MTEHVTTHLFIDGKACPAAGGATYALVNPARPTETVGYAAAASRDDVDAAMQAAQNAFAGWSALSYEARAAQLKHIADSLNADVEETASRARLLTTPQQKRTVEAMLEEATAAGQDIRYFGQIDDADDFTVGQFLRPSLVIDADPSLSVVKDEQFGPTLPVIPYDTEDDAIAMANDSDYGLSSSVWSSDSTRALAVARRLEAGFTNINSHGPTAMDGLTPFGGVKQSGIGRNFGPDGVRRFQEIHSISGQSGQIF